MISFTLASGNERSPEGRVYMTYSGPKTRKERITLETKNQDSEATNLNHFHPSKTFSI